MSAGLVEGIVLRKTDYSETSVILKVLTEKEGVQSFIFQGAKRKNKKGNIISPLSILSFEYYKRNDSQLAKIKSIEPSIIFKNIPFDPYKSSILFFMNEVLNNIVKEKEDNESLFHFLKNILQILDLDEKTANFPIKFLFHLTKHLGFFPQINENPQFFDLQEGTFISYQPNHPFYINKKNTSLLLAFSGTKFDGNNDPNIDLQTRRELVYDLLKYYEIIFDNFKEIQSLAILESTFHD